MILYHILLAHYFKEKGQEIQIRLMRNLVEIPNDEYEIDSQGVKFDLTEKIANHGFIEIKY